MSDLIRNVNIDRDGRQGIRAVHVQFGPGARQEVRVLEQEGMVIVEFHSGDYGVRLECSERGSEFQQAINLLRLHLPRACL